MRADDGRERSGAAPSSPAPSRSALTLLGFYTLAVLWLTLGPVPWAQASLADNPLGILNPEAWADRSTWLSGRGIEPLANVLLFIPFGYAAARLGRSRLLLLAPFVLTLAIELAQIVLPDRASDPRDLVANAIGAGIGIVLARARRSVPRPLEPAPRPDAVEEIGAAPAR